MNESVMEKVLIIDGHSAIHATSWLLELHDENQMAGRDALVRELSQLQDMTDFHVVVVFDGKGASRSHEGGDEKEILVIYSRGNETADRVIERIAVQQAKKYDVQVASNDRMVLDSTYTSGAHGMSITNLWDLFENALSRYQKKYRR